MRAHGGYLLDQLRKARGWLSSPTDVCSAMNRVLWEPAGYPWTALGWVAGTRVAVGVFDDAQRSLSHC